MPEEGEHERDCDCDECQLNEYRRRLTKFERFCWNWYFENINQFTLEAGIAGENIKELGLKGMMKNLFLRALNMIYQNNLSIQNERTEKLMEEKRKS